ncbi:MAG: type II secretion system protein [Candidatus Dadabacteria bacterium]|nr:type II secretion system protein [Candidatus Dadabacteria bacterium]NIS07351.1 type II secretion system protein [Candidatus Dadabacteria bacterium]NIV41295.1 prepilin-type N-terminal cleavage/methylation domain-containing protein [Candidatus Dadabacteria bacterium]NIX14530.1 prepilin-type N-terminal cleavage/methylation domain-containing protein [Candidatus Dadabacteria bacterium]NIY20988.1 prepilin-type N-terminal cleavage/methylation domain-containing protein [Candidatus Dadabacteria bacte
MNHKNSRGFTLIELLVVAAILGILLAIAIPNLIKARISANEANARKSMQTLRDAEGMYYYQDLNNNGILDFTSRIGDLNTPNSLRCPSNTAPCVEQDSTLDNSFEGAVTLNSTADCVDNKAGYCLKFAEELGLSSLEGDFGWKASMARVRVTGNKDFSVYSDGTIRCTLSFAPIGSEGAFSANRNTIGCD